MPISKKEYLAAKALLETEYRRRLRELEISWQNFGEKENREAGLFEVGAKTTKTKKGLKQATLEALAHVGPEFTIKDIRDIVMRDNPEMPIRTPALSTALIMLERSKEIAIVKRGAGRTPTIYKKH